MQSGWTNFRTKNGTISAYQLGVVCAEDACGCLVFPLLTCNINSEIIISPTQHSIKLPVNNFKIKSVFAIKAVLFSFYSYFRRFVQWMYGFFVALGRTQCVLFLPSLKLQTFPVFLYLLLIRQVEFLCLCAFTSIGCVDTRLLKSAQSVKFAIQTTARRG